MYIKGIINDTLFPLIKLFRPYGTFIFRNNIYEYCINKRSWNSERVVEIPIVSRYINRNERILEVGNVLSQFMETQWDIVDKFEKGTNIINVDIIDYSPPKKYDLIVSVSTLEHIGFDEDVGGGEKLSDKYKDNDKIRDVITKLKTLLTKDGKIVVTLPIGFNKNIDRKIFNDSLQFDETFFMRRISVDNKWKQIPISEIINPQYNFPFSCANYICIGIIKP